MLRKGGLAHLRCVLVQEKFFRTQQVFESSFQYEGFS